MVITSPSEVVGREKVYKNSFCCAILGGNPILWPLLYKIFSSGSCRLSISIIPNNSLRVPHSLWLKQTTLQPTSSSHCSCINQKRATKKSPKESWYTKYTRRRKLFNPSLKSKEVNGPSIKKAETRPPDPTILALPRLFIGPPISWNLPAPEVQQLATCFQRCGCKNTFPQGHLAGRKAKAGWTGRRRKMKFHPKKKKRSDITEIGVPLFTIAP